MKIFTAAQLHEWDQATILEQDISADMLMERAAVAFTQTLLPHLKGSDTIAIICGTGNNGGDGLCIARLLHRKGFQLHAVVYGDLARSTPDHQLNMQRAKKAGVNILLGENDILPAQVSSCSIIIDALFGSGLTRPLTAMTSSLVKQLNALDAQRFAVDLPSGLAADVNMQGEIFRAHHTFTFETPKRTFFYPEDQQYTGEWKVISIGLSQKWKADAHTSCYVSSIADMRALLHERALFAHKGSNGHALIVAGSTATPGAAALCSFAALEGGAGLVTLCSDIPYPEHPEVMLAERTAITQHIQNPKINAIAVGPGMGVDDSAIALMRTILQTAKQRLVLDADALHILSLDRSLFSFLPQGTILTPHPGEYARLFGSFGDTDALLDDIRKRAIETKCVWLYKRAFTIIALPNGDIWFNSTGNPGMATAGSGDVLTGMITALLAQGYRSEDAALLGVYLHGLSGDLAMSFLSGQNLVASDLIDNMQEAFAFLL